MADQQPTPQSALMFGDTALLDQARSLLSSIETLPDTVHSGRLHQLVYDTIIALSTLQTTGDYKWPQPQFRDVLATPPEAPVESTPEEIVEKLHQAGYQFTTEVASEIVDATGSTVEEVPSMEVMATRLYQALVYAGVTFPAMTDTENASLMSSLEKFLKGPSIDTTQPFLITDPNDPDHLLKVTFEGFNIKVESTLPSKKPDEPLTPLEVLSNPINTLPIVEFPSMQNLIWPHHAVHQASYPKAEGSTPSVFSAPEISHSNQA